MAEIFVINPRFDVSFWGLEHALPLLGKRANLPVASLPLLAALTPEPHCITLIDENVEVLDFDRIARADIVGVTGMIVQRFRMREILEQLKRRGALLVVGGPWVSVHEDYFGDLADVIFVGEAEETWPRFLREWEQGVHAARYEQAERSDMTKVPCPRYDLLPTRQYMFGGLQFSRGCPFQCEFCDIIVTFGRRPRLKTADQVIVELEALRRAGFRIVFIVDDNLIGNKTAVKQLLLRVVDWQRQQGYPLTFFTEASLDLAEDDELLRLFAAANIQSVFIGIESPNPESLRETMKLQNVRQRGGTMLEKIRHVQDFNIEVWCGMILGFDHDDSSIFQAQVDFLTDARIVHVMMGMLVAIPKTPLYQRLRSAGRLDEADPPDFGTNVIPLLMSREELSAGYVRVMQQLYDGEAYFDRVDSIYLDPNFKPGAAQAAYLRRRPWSRLKENMRTAAIIKVLERRVMRMVEDPQLRKLYRNRLANIKRLRRDPQLTFIYLLKCITHYHYQRMVAEMTQPTQSLVNSF